jgi:hypothetical protein
MLYNLFCCRESWRAKKDNATAEMEIGQQRLAENGAKAIKVFVCHTSLESLRKNNGKKNMEMLRYSNIFYNFLVCTTVVLVNACCY